MSDYIVVGAGAAGCVLAARLSEDPGARVLLVEAGPGDRSPGVQVPAAFAQLFGTRRDWDLRTTPQAALAGRSLRWPRGRMIGGSTSMNAQMYVRGQRADFDAWAEEGAEGWAWEDVEPFFGRVEGSSSAVSPALASGGPQVVEDLRSPSPLTAAFLRAAGEVGIAAGDPNHADARGASATPVTQRRGRRWSAADAYLHPVRRRRNLTVLTGATVRRVLVEEGRAVGVEVQRGRTVERLRARREVVLAAGAIGSPHLLLASGIGPSDHLAEVGVPVVADLPAVGGHLADHLMAITVMTTPVPVSLATATRPRHLGEWLLRRRGPLTSNVAEALALVDPGRTGGPPDVELVFAPVPYLDHGATPPPGHGFSVGAVLLQPRSMGTVRLADADPTRPPLIDPAYLTDPDGADLARLGAAVRLARAVIDAPAFAPYSPAPLRAAGEDVAAFVREQAETIYHPVGTCRMGRDASDSVVDSQLRVRGLDGLRVADASVMPRIVRGHTAAATMMVAERAATMVADRQERRVLRA